MNHQREVTTPRRKKSRIDDEKYGERRASKRQRRQRQGRVQDRDFALQLRAVGK